MRTCGGVGEWVGLGVAAGCRLRACVSAHACMYSCTCAMSCLYKSIASNYTAIEPSYKCRRCKGTVRRPWALNIQTLIAVGSVQR